MNIVGLMRLFTFNICRTNGLVHLCIVVVAVVVVVVFAVECSHTHFLWPKNNTYSLRYQNKGGVGIESWCIESRDSV